MAGKMSGDPQIANPSPEERRSVDTSQVGELPSPKALETNAAISVSLSAESGGSGKFAMDERLHTWLEEEVSEMGLDEDSKQAGQQQKLHIKILVSNSASGSIIGKVGMNIHHTQLQTGAKIQLSKARQFFPGTNERTLLLRGNLGQIASAIYMIYLRLIDEKCAPIIMSPKETGESIEAAEDVAGTGIGQPISEELGEIVASALLQIKILIPEDLCGIIVGRSGSTIKLFSETTNTSIRLLKSPKVPSPALSHNIVSIRGHLIDVIKAIALIILKQSDDPDYQNYGHLTRTYYMYGSNTRFGTVHHLTPGMMYVPNYPAPIMQGQAMSIIYPLTLEQQRLVAENMAQMSHYIQQMTGVLPKFETMPDQEGFAIRLDGSRDAIFMASSLLNNYINPQACNTVLPNVAPY